MAPPKPAPKPRQKLAQVFQVPLDLDYVQAFQDLAQLQILLRKDGPSGPLLLRKAELERLVGNHMASLTAAKDALALDPSSPEMHYEVGLAYFYLALAKAGALPIAPKPTNLPDEGVAQLLALALDSFTTVLSLNPNDEDAARDITAIAAVLESDPDDAELAAALRAQTA